MKIDVVGCHRQCLFNTSPQTHTLFSHLSFINDLPLSLNSNCYLDSKSWYGISHLQNHMYYTLYILTGLIYFSTSCSIHLLYILLFLWKWVTITQKFYISLPNCSISNSMKLLWWKLRVTVKNNIHWAVFMSIHNAERDEWWIIQSSLSHSLAIQLVSIAL